MEYETVIGLEVHSELNTNTKCFCGCKNEFGAPTNSLCCPICTGMPGALPVVNAQAVRKAILMGLAVGSKINNYSVMERKNYYYPDLSKAYQISQMEYPFCLGGGLEIEVNGKKKYVRLNRIHLEEDAAKLIHDKDGTMVDYNRGGVPLIEIVSEPDMNSAEEAVAYLQKLRTTLLYVGVSDCKMQEGSIKFDVNVSVHKKGEPLGTRAELKNLNSFKSALSAIKYEAQRQIDIIEDGGQVIQETRRWDDVKGKTLSMRTKEDSQDYRYFPDPDIIPIEVTDEYITEIKKSLPQLPEERQQVYIALGLTEQDAKLITSEKIYADYFDNICKEFNQPKFVCNWITSEIFKKINSLGAEELVLPIPAHNMASLLKMYYNNEINQVVARQLLDELWEKGGDPVQIVEERGLKQVNDTVELRKILQNIIDNNAKAVEELKSGNEKTVAFFIGQAMRSTQGKANPKVVAELLNELIKK